MQSYRHQFFMKLASALTIMFFAPLALNLAPLAEAAGSIDIWWPTEGSHVTGTQPLKAMVEGMDVNSYDMYWQVDGGSLNPMPNSSTDYPHKETSINVSTWTWHGAGPYAVTLIVKQGDAVVAQKTVNIYTDATAASGSAPLASTGATTLAPSGSAPVSVWWPTPNASLSGVQPFKAAVSGRDPSSYSIYWSVDNGVENAMTDSTTDGAHKETQVDLSTWTWQPNHQYSLTFTAKDVNGVPFASYTEAVTANSGGATVSAPQAIQTAQALSQPATAPFSSASFYADPNSSAAQQANSWASSRPADAEAMRLLASAPTARWFGEWSGDIASSVSSYVSAAGSAGKTAVLVAYDIPQRDCGGYSAGGTNDYLSWISGFARGIGAGKAVVVLEPDSLAQMSCLSSADQATRYSLLSQAVAILKKNPNTKVYLDAGHADWVNASDMAGRLSRAGVKSADGFALNVSNYDATANEETYGDAVSKALGGAHYIIDTSRNGNGGNGDWCNATGRAIGALPTVSTGSSLVDAFLWVKTPGESDGTCNGGPSAGAWWPDYALSLVRNAHS